MLFGLNTVAEYFLGGGLLALTFFILRSSIDRHKGALVEVAAVTLTLAIAAAFLAVAAPQLTALEYGTAVSRIIQAVFMALPVLAAVRFMERRRLGEQVQLVDLFRTMTIASLVVYVSASLHLPAVGILLLICLGAYLASEWAAETENRDRNLALGFVVSFITMVITCVALRFRLILDTAAWPWMMLNPQPIQEGLAMIGLLLPQLLLPRAVEAIALQTRWFPRLAFRLACWRHSIGRPQDLIYVRTVLDLWRFDKNVCYLNHGSFGAVPIVLRNEHRRIREACENEPMDFLSRRLESLWLDARFKLAVWLGTPAENIAFCENATAGMNEIASWFPLAEGDEVLLNDHEYGAVRRIWKRRCEAAGAKLVDVILPWPLTAPQQIADAILAACSHRTRLVVLSHITSPTAIKLPVETICPLLRERGIASCIDGPHALLQEEFKLYRLRCDFYVASCHKWLCAPLGSGFVYVDPRWHTQVKPARLSWGRLNPAKPESWSDELLWTGSRDYSAYLMVPLAIEFFAKLDRQKLDARHHALACYARRRLSELPGAEPVTPEGREWFGWMVAVWLPSTYRDYASLQQRLWERYRIEVPIVHFAGRHLVRVSCHLYVSTHDIDTLVRCLHQELRRR